MAKQRFFSAMLVGILGLQMTACGFHLRGYQTPMSQNIPNTTLIFSNSRADIALKNALNDKFSLLAIKTTTDNNTPNNQTPSIEVKNIRLQNFQLRGVLTEIRMVMSADVTYHILQNGKIINKTNTIQVQRSYQYDQASVNIDNPQADQIQNWLYDNLAERIADQYMALSLPQVNSNTLITNNTNS